MKEMNSSAAKFVLFHLNDDSAVAAAAAAAAAARLYTFPDGTNERTNERSLLPSGVLTRSHISRSEVKEEIRCSSIVLKST